LGPSSRASCLLQYLFTKEERLSAGISLTDLQSSTRDISQKFFIVDGVAIPAPELVEERVAGAAVLLRRLAKFLEIVEGDLRRAGFFNNRHNQKDRLYPMGTEKFFCDARDATDAGMARPAAEVADEIMKLSLLSTAALKTRFDEPATIAKLEADLDDAWARRIPAPRASMIGSVGYMDATGTCLEDLESWIGRKTSNGSVSAEDGESLRDWLTNPILGHPSRPTVGDGYDAALLEWLSSVGYDLEKEPAISVAGRSAWKLALELDAPLTLLMHLSGYGLSAPMDDETQAGKTRQTEDADLVKPSVPDDEPRTKDGEPRRPPLDRSIYRRLQSFLKGVQRTWVREIPDLAQVLDLEVASAAARLALRTAEARAALSAGALLYRDVVTYLDEHRAASRSEQSEDPDDTVDSKDRETTEHEGADDADTTPEEPGGLPTLAATGGTRWARNHIRQLIAVANEGTGLSDQAEDRVFNPTPELTAELWKSIHNADYRQGRLSDPLNAWREVSGAVTSLTYDIRKKYKDGHNTGATPHLLPDSIARWHHSGVGGDDATGNTAVGNADRPETPPVYERIQATADHVIHELDVPKFWAILLSREGHRLRVTWNQAYREIRSGGSPQAPGQPELAATWDELIDYVDMHRVRYA
jgi:hypothetical protein